MTAEEQLSLFEPVRLPAALERDLRRLNPWWAGDPIRPLPATRRHLVSAMRHRLRSRLAPAVMVRGPRQIGKTTAQLHFIQDLLAEGVSPRRILRVQFDELPSLMSLQEPIPLVLEWYEKQVLGQSLNAAARADEPAYVFLDEVQNLSDWAPQLKHVVDASSFFSVVTGSSALRIERGRDSLAGRITTIECGVLSLTEIAQFHRLDLGAPLLPDNGLEPLTRKAFWLEAAEQGREYGAVRDEAFSWFSQRGGYPLAHERAEAHWGQLADQLNENVIRRVIRHDLRVGDRGRKRDEQLLQEVFRLACRYVGQCSAPGLLAREAQRSLGANVGDQRIRHYLQFLGDTLLLRLIPPLEIRLKRTRGNPKLCLADHALRASWLQEVVPLDPAGLENDPHLSDLAGHVAESVVSAVLCSISGLDVAHQPTTRDQPEVDFVLVIGTVRVPIEVKYRRRIDPLRDTEGLRSFLERSANNAPFGVLVTLNDTPPLDDPRIVALPLSSLMLLR